MVASFEDTGRRAVRSSAAPELARRALRRAIHFASYNFVLNRRSTRTVRADGFRLVVRPTVFHPRYFVASEYFSRFVTQLNLRDLNVLDVGTGTGIIALSAARAGAANVVAVDINPNAALSARENALAHGFADRMSVVCGDLLSALAPKAAFDVILSNPPFFPEEPIDVADRAWHAGPGYRDIKALFEQARQCLAPGGRFYLLLSSDSDLGLIGSLIEQAKFRARLVGRKSLLIESLVLFELRQA
ncbi:MAG: methyltransferase [Xanthobacteraceae bacterium]|nr:methyltransferase [Xanthobacteraceae bacterium]